MISQCCLTAKDYYSESETVAYVESWMQNALDRHYDPDLLCLYAVFARFHSDGQISSLDSEIYSKDTIIKALKRFGSQNVDIEVEHELDSFLSNQDPMFGTIPSSTYWKSYGIKVYPRLSQFVLPIFVYPSSESSYELLRSIKSFIHFHVRLKKEGPTQVNHNQDEMMISCNRHLLIRWDLDFQYLCLFESLRLTCLRLPIRLFSQFTSFFMHFHIKSLFTYLKSLLLLAFINVKAFS